MSMDAFMDNLAGILTVLGTFVVLALPSLIGLAHERRIDRQLREADERNHRETRQGPGRVGGQGPARHQPVVRAVSSMTKLV